MHTATGPPNPAWSKIGNLSSPGDPPTPREPESEKGDIVASPAGLEEAGSLSSKAHGHVLLGVEQPAEQYGSEVHTGMSPAALEASEAAGSGLGFDSNIAATDHAREAVTEASGSNHGSAHNSVAADATTEAVTEASGAVDDRAGSIVQSWHDGVASRAGVEADGAAGGRVLRGALGKTDGEKDIRGPSRRLLDVFGESLRHVDNLLNARWDL